MFSIELRNIGRLDMLALTGHILALLAVVGLLLVQATLPAIIVTAILTLTYVAQTWRTRFSFYLYPATLFLTATYLLIVGQVGWLDAMLFWLLPLQIALFGLAYVFRRQGKSNYAIPLEVGGHVGSLYLVGKFLMLSDTLSQPILVVAGLALIAVIDLGLARLHRERWFLFSAAVFVALAYLFVLLFAPGGPPEALIVYYSGAAVLYALLGWWVRRSYGGELAEPIEAAALLIGIVGVLSGLLAGTAIGLNAVLVGAVAFGLLFVSSREHIYIYLVILSAGAIGFQFIRIAGERYSPRLVDQFLIGLAIIGIVFFYPVILK